MVRHGYNSSEYCAQQLRDYLEGKEFERNFPGNSASNIRHSCNIVCFDLTNSDDRTRKCMVKFSLKNDVPYVSLEKVLDGVKETEEIKLRVTRTKNKGKLSPVTFRDYFVAHVLRSKSTL